MDVLLAAEEFPTERLNDRLSTMSRCTQTYRQLAAEQAALRRLAMLVAQGVEPSEVFGAVINEMCQCVSPHRPPDCGATRQAAKSRF